MATVYFRLNSFISCLILLIISQSCSAQPNFLYHFCANDKGNYTVNSTYHNNLNTLLSNLSSNREINYGFYNFSNGQNADKVNAIGLCRGDVKPDECRTCLNDSRDLLTRLCPNQKEAIAWYDKCMLRYSNRSIFGVMETSPSFYMWNLINATEVDQFNRVLRNLLNRLRTVAVMGDSHRKYAFSNASMLNFESIYGFVQCTPDLSGVECQDCLTGAISEIPNCCSAKRGARIVRPSCNVRYDTYRFYGSAAYAPVPAPAPSPL